jgi:hypothetical protein
LVACEETVAEADGCLQDKGDHIDLYEANVVLLIRMTDPMIIPRYM